MEQEKSEQTVAPAVRPSVCERVAKGAEFLDDMHHLWWTEIDISELDINSLSCCILAQLYEEDFDTGADELGLTASDCIGMGFWPNACGGDGNEDGDQLTLEWLRVIRARKEHQ